MRTCTICTNPQRSEIDASILSGKLHSDIAAQFNIGRMSVQRHASLHIAKAVQQSREAREEAQGLDVVAQLKEINGVALSILKEARQKDKPSLALQAIDRIERQLILQSKLLGDIGRTEVNVWLPVPWQEIEKAIYNALSRFPEARMKVVEALQGLEQGK